MADVNRTRFQQVTRPVVGNVNVDKNNKPGFNFDNPNALGRVADSVTGSIFDLGKKAMDKSGDVVKVMSPWGLLLDKK
ncbi:MAG: alkaline phosphatase family protein [Cyanobacteria bacterium]|nr:alkaline phosphatase family protein [Cyanobacteriota bacterium]